MPRPGRYPNPSRLSAKSVGHSGSGGWQRTDVAARDGRYSALLPRMRGEPGVHEQPHVRRRSDGVRQNDKAIEREGELSFSLSVFHVLAYLIAVGRERGRR